MKIRRSISEPIRISLSWEQRWRSADQGLISAWESGRERRQLNPSLSAQAEAGHLVVLGWKGGVRKKIQAQKFGTYNYLAMWQGLRGEELDIDTEKEVDIICTKTGMVVTFTSDQGKYADSDEVEQLAVSPESILVPV